MRRGLSAEGEEDDDDDDCGQEEVVGNLVVEAVVVGGGYEGQIFGEGDVGQNLLHEAVWFRPDVCDSEADVDLGICDVGSKLDIGVLHCCLVIILRRAGVFQLSYSQIVLRAVWLWRMRWELGAFLCEMIDQSMWYGIWSIKMNINQPNAEKLLSGESRGGEAAPEARDAIEQLNPITLLKKPDEFKQAFFSMACLSAQAFKGKNYERAALALNKCVDMLDLGRNILKEINRYWKLVVFANLACCYHYTRKLSKCNKFCERIKDELQRILAETTEKEVFLKLSRVLVKLKFQHCAILSQLEQHDKAFELCKSTLPMLKQVIETLLAYVQSNSTLETLQKRSSETVQFSRQVHRFAQGLLTDLLKAINQPLKGKERSVFYYWQKNPQQNEEQVKKKFIPHGDNNTCKRSILGVSKSTHWIDQFNIGTIMHFSEMTINDFDSGVPIEQYLFKDRLYQLVIYSSMANFTMATQLRLIESTQAEKSEGLPVGSAYSTLMKKYGYEQKSQLYILSEIYHLRSIDIMARNIRSTVPYLTHIIRSYQKHYIKHKKVLQPIAAIVQESALSLNESMERGQRQEQQVYYETTYNNFVNKNNNQYVLDKNQYQDAEPIGDLLLESQNYQPQQFVNKGLVEEERVIRRAEKQDQEKEKEEKPIIKKSELEVRQSKLSVRQSKLSVRQSKLDGKQLQAEERKSEKQQQQNSWVGPPQQTPNKMLLTVKSDGNLHRQAVESPRDDHNNSGQYLKSHKNKSTSKVKKPVNREKSSSKLGGLRTSNYQVGNLTHRQSKKEKEKEKTERRVEGDKYNDYKLKGERGAQGKKERERKTLKKERVYDFDNDKYGQKEIKIKTESCTHIKVFYKKKK